MPTPSPIGIRFAHGEEGKLVVAVPKARVRTAVVRNRIRRRIRAAFKTARVSAGNVTFVVTAGNEAAHAPFEELVSAFRNSVSRRHSS